MIEALKTKMINFLKSSTRHSNGRKTKGQAMVEFALALPILLTVVYGLLETGRLLFIYGSTVTAARQAARYGSATGTSENGVPYYRDCTGIQNAVNRLGFIHTYSSISITYDRGLDSSGNVVSIPGVNSDPSVNTCNTMNDSTLVNGDRIKVRASTVWTPILNIVPSWQGFTITSSAERTLITGVAITDDENLVEWSPGFTLAVSASPTTFDEAGDTINYTYTLSNVGSTTINGAFSVTDDHTTVTCSGAPASLAAGASFTCSGTHTITQAEVDAGSIASTATANSSTGTSNVVTVTITGVQISGLTLQASGTKSGSVINYTYTLLNSGKVTLTSPYAITATGVTVNCSTASSSLAPNASTTCSGTYNITGSEGNSYTSIATATATFGVQTITSNSTSVTTNLANLTLSISAKSSNGNSYIDNETQNVVYTYTLTNVGTTTLNGPFTITDNRATGISCASISISASASITCTGSYDVTLSDMNAGLDITNQATASAGTSNSNQATSTISITQTKALTVFVSPSTTLATSAGTVITYTYTLSNSGNVTLTSPYTVTDTGHTGTITCASSASIAPAAATTCTSSYTVTAANITNGSIVSSATATAKFGTSTITSASASATVITFNSPRLTLTITSSPTTFGSTGVPLNYTLTLKNTGNVALTTPYGVTGNAKLGTVSCPSSPASIAIGSSINCTSTYTTLAADVTTRSVSVSATATAKNGAATVTSNTATLTVSYVMPCYVYHRLSTDLTSITYPGPGQRNMAMKVISDAATGGTIYISSIQLLNWNYSSSSSQYVSSISFGGVQIATGNVSQRTDPVTYSAPYSGDVSLTPGSTKQLLIVFNRNYTALGNEIIKITFTDASCPVLDSSNALQVK